MSGANLVALILGSSALGAVLAAVVTGAFSKRKLGAEATEIITRAASSVVTNIEADLERAREDRERLIQEHREEQRNHELSQLKHREEMQKLVAAYQRERDEWRAVLQLHVAWDAIALQKLTEAGVDVSGLPEVPPLLPPVRHVDDSGYPRG